MGLTNEVIAVLLAHGLAVLWLIVRNDRKLAVLTQRLRQVERQLDIEMSRSAHNELM
jgi:hypothetical protein